MLSCMVGNKSINSFDYNESKLREWSNKEILRCPECGERVIYCNGDYKIPYFKHEVASECVGNVYYEPMTDEHINGIKALYERLKSIDGVKNLEVEKYIKNTKQRPDIYFEYKCERYCIEYQCSPISTQYNKRHELYELEGIKDIWILGTEKYGFEKYIDGDGYVEFKEKKIKTIEDEIDKSSSPLLYFIPDIKHLYSVDEQGFRCITRWNGKYETFKNSILKTKVKVKLDTNKLNEININTFVSKKNKDISTILKGTSQDIIDIEKGLKVIKDSFSVDVKFVYNLDNDRFPIYKINLLGNNEFYNGAREIKDFISNYIDYLNKVIPTFNDVNNGDYIADFSKEILSIKNIKESLVIFNQNVTTEIKKYSIARREYIYDFSLDGLKEIIKNSITYDKRRITIDKNNKIKKNNLINNKNTIKSVMQNIDKKNVDLCLNDVENYLKFKYENISNQITISDQALFSIEYYKNLIEDMIVKVIEKNNEYVEKNAYFVSIDRDDNFPKTVSEIASDYGLSGRRLNEILCELNIQKPTLKGGYKSIYGITRYRKIQHNKWTTYIIWDKRGAKVIYEALKDKGIQPNIEKVNKEV